MSVVKTKEQSVAPSPKISSDLEKLMKEEARMVSGRFRNYEVKGGSLPFQAKKYPNQPVFKKTFQDGEVCDVPLWVARWLNGVDAVAKGLNGKIGSCSYPVHGFKWDAGSSSPGSIPGQGGTPVPIVGIAKRVQRYGFESLEFDSGVA